MDCLKCSEIMAEGTPITSLETGAVSDKADNALMNQILADIGNAGGDVKTADAPQTIPLVAPPMGGIPTYSPHQGMPVGPPGMMHMPPGYLQNMMHMSQINNSGYEDDEEEMQPRPKPKVKKNFASSFLEFVRDPFIVAVLLIVLSLPVLHTHVGRLLPALYSSGGMLSWLGLVSVGLGGALLFILFRSIAYLIGL